MPRGLVDDQFELDEAQVFAHYQGVARSDDDLLALAGQGDDEALTELWNRYYIAAFRAAAAKGATTRPADLVASSFQRWINRVGKGNLSFDDFLNGWFLEVAHVQPPPISNRAVTWAFYALNERDRAIVWRQHVDSLNTERLIRECHLPTHKADHLIARANARFTNLLAMVAKRLGLPTNADDLDDPAWITTTLMLGLLDWSSTTTGVRFLIDSRRIISPPEPPERGRAPLISSRHLSEHHPHRHHHRESGHWWSHARSA